MLNISYGTKNSSTPTILSNDTDKEKINEIAGYWDDANEMLIMTAESRTGNHSFTITIPALANRVVTIYDNDNIIGKYKGSDTGAITFNASFGGLHAFKITAAAPSGIVEDFFSYEYTVELQNTWYQYLANIQINKDSNFVDNNNCSILYDYIGDANIAAYVPSLPSLIGKNWTAGGVKSLSMSFYGQSSNSVLPMYIKLKDGDGNEGIVIYGQDGEDQNDLQVESWHEWNINLEKFRDAGVNLTDVENIYIGFGSGEGSGKLYISDIRLYQPRCLLSKRSMDLVKFDFAPSGNPCGDCVTDYKELARMASEWLESPPSGNNADLNGDGTIDMLDFAMLGNYWSQTYLWP